MNQVRQFLSICLLLALQVVFVGHSQTSNQSFNESGNYTGAMPQFFTAPAIDESQMDYYLSEGVSLEKILSYGWSKAQTGYYEGAEFYFRLASERFLNSYRAQASLATFFYQMGQSPFAIQQFQYARNIAGNDTDRKSANYFIERIARESRIGKEAVDAYYLGVKAYNSGDYVSAAGWLEQSLQATPDWVEAQYWLGRSYFELGQNTEAMMNLRQVLAALPATDERALGANWLLQQIKQ